MKIVFLGQNDWANTCNRIARAINRYCGVLRARAVTIKPHRFGYMEDVVIDRDGEEAAREALSGADWIISSGDGQYDVLRDLIARSGLPNRSFRLATRHAGSAYRSNPTGYDRIDSDWGFERRFFACDLYRFVIADPRARIFIQPQDRIAGDVPDFDPPLRVCHTASSRATKGTASIMSVLEAMKWKSIDLIENVGHQECANRMQRGHVLIDQFQPDIGGFGAAAMEALACGLAVVSHYGQVVREVERWLPMPPIINVLSERMLQEELSRMIEDQEYLMEVRRRGLAWAQQYLAPEFTHNYWYKCLES